MLFPGQTVLTYFGMEGKSAWRNVGYVWIFAAVALIAAWASLTFIRHQRR